MRKNGFTLIELMIVVAIIGILAAIAIPNFIKFQARSKQSEVKANLRAMFHAQRSFYQEKETYSVCIRKVGWAPERGNRYRYDVNVTRPTKEAGCGTAEGRADAAGITDPNDGAVLVDTFKFGAAAAVAAPGTIAYTPVPPPGSGIDVQANLIGVVPPEGGVTSSFGAVAAGNIDSDTQVDVWYIGSISSTTAGDCPALVGSDQNVPGGEPANYFNDVNCPL